MTLTKLILLSAILVIAFSDTCPKGYFHTRGGCERLPSTPKPVPAILPGPGYKGKGGCHDGFFHTRDGCEPYPGATCPKGYRIYNGNCIWDFTEPLPKDELIQQKYINPLQKFLQSIVSDENDDDNDNDNDEQDCKYTGCPHLFYCWTTSGRKNKCYKPK